MSRIAGRFTRVESRRRTRKSVLGLLSDLPRKNCWTIAEWAGDRTPDGMQHLLGRVKWDADKVGDYVVEHLHDHEAVLVLDETGDVKKATDTVGVQRQYTATAGRIENAQVAVYLVYADRRGHAAVDRELCVPRSWTSDPHRCRAAGLGDNTEFATKPELAARMVTRFLDTGHRAALVAGDEVHGGTPRLRTALEERGTGYVLAVACSHEVTTGARRFSRRRVGQEGAQEGLAEAVRRRPEPRATASTTGPPSTSPPPGPGAGDCRSAATAAPANVPTTAATRLPQCR